MNQTLLITIITAIASSTGIWGLLQTLMTRKERKTAQQREEMSLKREEDSRRELLAEAQNTAQRAALESAAERYTALHADYISVRDGLREIRNATSVLIEIFESILVMRLRPSDDGENFVAILMTEELAKLRIAITQARQYLN